VPTPETALLAAHVPFIIYILYEMKRNWDESLLLALLMTVLALLPPLLKLVACSLPPLLALVVSIVALLGAGFMVAIGVDTLMDVKAYYGLRRHVKGVILLLLVLALYTADMLYALDIIKQVVVILSHSCHCTCNTSLI